MTDTKLEDCSHTVARNDVIEECARVCKELKAKWQSGECGRSVSDFDACEAAIRALKQQAPEPVAVERFTEDQIVAAARALADRNAEICNVNKEDNWAIYGSDFIEDARSALSAIEADRNKRAPVGSLTDDDLLRIADDQVLGVFDDATGAFRVYLQPGTDIAHVVIAFARALLSSVAPRVPDVDWLSNVIRAADGNNTLGAGALAEKIVEAMIAAAQQVAPEGYVIVPVTLLEWAQQNIDNVEDEDERERISASLGDYIDDAIPTTAELPAT